MIKHKLCTKFKVSTFSYIKIQNEMQNVELGWFDVVQGHQRSSTTLPFDRTHTTSYLIFMKTIQLSCTIFELKIESFLESGHF